MFLGRNDQTVLRSKWVCCFGCQWSQHCVLEIVWGQDKAQTFDPVLSIPRSRAVILLGISLAVCQILQRVTSQGGRLVSQSEAAFQEFSRGRLASALCEQSQRGHKGTDMAQGRQ